MESIRVKTDEIVTLPEPTFVYPGYNLTKWKYPQPWSNYDNICAADGTFKMPPYNVVLSAVWEPNLNTIKFVDNYQDSYQANNRCEYTNSIITISNYWGYVPGYTFAGWSPEQNNSTTIYKEYSNYKVGPEPEQILYAVYEPVNYYSEYVCRLNSYMGKDITHLICNNPNPIVFNIETETFQLQPVEIDGYTFLGWADTDGNICNDMFVKKGSMSNQIFYAIFKEDINYLDLKTIQHQFNIKNNSNNGFVFYSKTYSSNLYENDFTGFQSSNFAYAYIDYDAKTQIGTLKYVFALVADNTTDLSNKIKTLSNYYSGILKISNVNDCNGFTVVWCSLELLDPTEIENIKQMYVSDNATMNDFALTPYQISQLDKNNVLNIIELYHAYFAIGKVVIES